MNQTHMEDTAYFWLAILQLIASQGQREMQVTLSLFNFWVTRVLLAMIKQISWISKQANIIDIFLTISLLIVIKLCPCLYIFFPPHFSLKANMSGLLI